jgi:hypothetical protein
MKRMNEHVQVLGWLYIILNGVGLLVGGLVLTFVPGMGGITHGGTFGTLSLISLLIGNLMLIMAVLFFPGMVAGIGLLLGSRGWARILGLIVGGLSLINFPIGTALGVYAIWVLLQPETRRMLGAGAAGG